MMTISVLDSSHQFRCYFRYISSICVKLKNMSRNPYLVRGHLRFLSITSTGTHIFVRKTLKNGEICNLVGPWNGPLKECAVSSRVSLDTLASNPYFRGDSYSKSAFVYAFHILTQLLTISDNFYSRGSKRKLSLTSHSKSK